MPRYNEHWRGCENVDFTFYNTTADPDINYKGYAFNYWDIENALWCDFAESKGVDINEMTTEFLCGSEEEFNKYCQENADTYLDDVIASGYFEEGSTSWHDRYKRGA